MPILKNSSMLLVIIVMIGLGCWQIARGLEKTAQADLWQTYRANPVNVDRINHATNNHQRIRLHGQYLPVNEYITLRRNGHPMTIVLSPFQTTSNDFYWVQRGQLKPNANDANLPQNTPIIITADIQAVTPPMNGLLEQHEPHHWQGSYRSLNIINQTYSEPLNADTLLSLTPGQATDLENNKLPPLPTPWQHYGYTVQFFLVAFFITIRYYLTHAARVNQSY